VNKILLGFRECEEPARRLAECLAIPFGCVSVRHFPDGESLVSVGEAAPDTAILYRSLDDPNAKLIELFLAASALRDCGTRRVILVAPYLAYMRQDIAFHPGEAVSQRVIGQMIASHFDALITVDPHLHRITRLEDVMPGIRAIAVPAAPALVAMLAQDLAPDTVLVGPDSESRQWVGQLATALGLDCIIGEKYRNGDRAVDLELPDVKQIAGRPALMIDDLISSGGTLLACAELLHKAGAIRVEAAASHCLASADDLARLARGGIARIRATDTVPGPAACAPIAPVLADALKASGLLDG
jgi:ribose-phosphate pyrophosphokinase